MKIFAAFLTTLVASSALAADPAPRAIVHLAQTGINVYILLASGLGGAFPQPNRPDPVDVERQLCVSAGTAYMGFYTLRGFNYTDEEIKPLMAPTSGTATEIQEAAILKARQCGLLF